MRGVRWERCRRVLKMEPVLCTATSCATSLPFQNGNSMLLLRQISIERRIVTPEPQKVGVTFAPTVYPKCKYHPSPRSKHQSIDFANHG